MLEAHDPDGWLRDEYRVLAREHGRVQARCDALLRSQAQEIAALHRRAIRMQAALIIRETALAWAHEDRRTLEQAIPGLRSRIALARHVGELVTRMQDLLRERLCWQWHEAQAAHEAGRAAPAQPSHDDPEHLEASLQAADLVICQTGCLSHGAYWRVQDHCQRTGKTCVLVSQPDALRIVRIHKAPEGDDSALVATAIDSD